MRLGIDRHPHDDDVRVINGIRRGEDLHPLLIRSVGNPAEGLEGFEAVPQGVIELTSSLTETQLNHWNELPPNQFRFEEGVKSVPRTSLYRLIERAKSVGLLLETGGVYKKTSPGFVVTL